MAGGEFNRDKAEAVKLLQHYFEQTGVMANSDNFIEIENFVYHIIEAVKFEIKESL